MTTAGLVRLRRPALTLITCGLWLLATIGPAGAAAAVPTNYLTRIVDVRWADTGGAAPQTPIDRLIAVRILGGDASIELTVMDGAVVEVDGYHDDDPYLRVAADGTVRVNVASTAFALNGSRFGGSDGSSGGGPAAAGSSGGVPAAGESQDSGSPSKAGATERTENWEVVDRSGRFEWHDHRAHWMSAQPPLGVTAWDGDGDPPRSAVAIRGTIPLTVNGRLAEIETVTYLLRPPSAAFWWSAAAAFAVVAVVVGRAVPARRWSAAALVPAALLAAWAVVVVFLLGSAERWAPWHVALPVAAVAVLGWGAMRSRPWREVGALGGLALVGTGVTLIATWGSALTPGLGPSWLARLVGAAALGLGAAFAASGCWELLSVFRVKNDRLASTVTE